MWTFGCSPKLYKRIIYVLLYNKKSLARICFQVKQAHCYDLLWSAFLVNIITTDSQQKLFKLRHSLYSRVHCRPVTCLLCSDNDPELTELGKYHRAVSGLAGIPISNESRKLNNNAAAFCKVYYSNICTFVLVSSQDM